MPVQAPSAHILRPSGNCLHGGRVNFFGANTVASHPRGIPGHTHLQVPADKLRDVVFGAFRCPILETYPRFGGVKRRGGKPSKVIQSRELPIKLMGSTSIANHHATRFLESVTIRNTHQPMNSFQDRPLQI